jgi:hypothetical protein
MANFATLELLHELERVIDVEEAKEAINEQGAITLTELMKELGS